MTTKTLQPSDVQYQRYRAAIFDLDGTLLDSLHDIANAANAALAAIGCPTHPIDDYRTLVGDGVRMLFQRASTECRENPEVLERCIQVYADAYAATWNRESQPYPGIVDMLTRLKRAGLRLAVLSNKPDAFTQQCVAHFFPEAQFEFVLGHSERFPRKPDPSSATYLVHCLGVEARSVAYVGDTNTDMQTAVGAKLSPIGVLWGFRSREELVESGARDLVATAEELAELLLQSE
ncbi:MAG: HAD family hydrolase [Pirellula sp.]